MPSFQISITPSRRAAARFVMGVRRAILKALEEEGKKSGLKQTDIARAIGVHRSVINRELRGKKDLTLGRVAELAWAMGRIPFFDLPERKLPAGSNLPQPTRTYVPAANVVPTFTASTSSGVPMDYLNVTRATPVALPTIKP
jgi:transcriptional regulator with XRE-family HTH domain